MAFTTTTISKASLLARHLINIEQCLLGGGEMIMMGCIDSASKASSDHSWSQFCSCPFAWERWLSNQRQHSGACDTPHIGPVGSIKSVGKPGWTASKQGHSDAYAALQLQQGYGCHTRCICFLTALPYLVSLSLSCDRRNLPLCKPHRCYSRLRLPFSSSSKYP